MEITPLCKLAYKHGTDKCPQIFHTYTPVYYEMFKDKSFKKVLELGIGTIGTMKHLENYKPGASLRMWRDFFPQAHIYGVDYVPEVIFQEERITTFLADTTKKEDMEELIKKIGSDIDLVIDDGPHHSPYQIFTAKTLMPLLKKDVIYIIEDVRSTRRVRNELSDYNVEIIRLERENKGVSIRDNNLVVVKHK